MALTQTDLNNLDSAIASGELKVQVDGRSVEYRSIGELLRARAHVAAVLATAGADGRPAKRHGSVYQFSFKSGRGE